MLHWDAAFNGLMEDLSTDFEFSPVWTVIMVIYVIAVLIYSLTNNKNFFGVLFKSLVFLVILSIIEGISEVLFLCIVGGALLFTIVEIIKAKCR